MFVTVVAQTMPDIFVGVAICGVLAKGMYAQLANNMMNTNNNSNDMKPNWQNGQILKMKWIENIADILEHRAG